jgi:uncharacterized protein
MLDFLTTGQWLLLAAITAGAYFVRGITGFGSGLIAIPLLALFLPLPVVVPMIGLLDYIASSGHGFRHRRQIRWTEILPLLPFTLLGVLSALYLFHTVDAALLSKILGGFVLLYALYILLNLMPGRQGSRWWAIPAGSFGGLIGTLFGTGGPFYVIYLSLRHLDKTVFRASIAMIFLLDGSSRIIAYFLSGFYHAQTIILVAVALPVMVVAMYLGGHVHTSLSQRAFQRGIGVLLIGSGMALLLR